MINLQLEKLRKRKEKLEQENKSLKRKQEYLQKVVNILLKKIRVKELEDMKRDLSMDILQNNSIKKFTDDLAEKCRKALEVNFGEIPLPNIINKNN